MANPFDVASVHAGQFGLQPVEVLLVGGHRERGDAVAHLRRLEQHAPVVFLNPFGPHQRARWVGSANALNTMRRGASMTRPLTISRGSAAWADDANVVCCMVGSA